MKRPLFIFGITYLISTVVCVYFLADFAFILGGALFAVGTVLWAFFLNKKFGGIFLSAAVAAFGFYIYNINNELPHLYGTEITMIGQVDDIKTTKEGEFITVKGKVLNTEDNTQTKAKIFSNTKNDLGVGDTVKIIFKDNPNFLDAKSLKGEKVYLSGYSKYIGRIDNQEINLHYQIKRAFINLRESMKSVINRNLWISTKGFVYSAITGDKSLMDDKTNNALVDSGIIHLTAVSGMHLMTFYIYADFICKKLQLGRRLSLIICSLFIIFYSLFCISSFSIARSLGMILVMIFSKFIRRVYDTRTSLGFVAVLFLVINPYSVCDIGFMLSFGATLGIVLFYKNVYTFLNGNPQANHRKVSNKNKILSKIVSPISVGIAANVLVVPLIILYFGKINIYSIIATLLVSWIIPFIFFTVPLMVLEVLFLGRAAFLTFALNIAVRLVIKITIFIAELPFSVIYLGENYILIAICLLYVAGVLLWYFKAKTKTVITIYCSLIMIFCGSYLLILQKQQQYYKIAVFDEAIMLSSDGRNIIVGNIKSDFEGKIVETYMFQQHIKNIDFQVIDKKPIKTSRANQYLIKNQIVNTVFIYKDCEDYINEIDKIMTNSQNINKIDSLNIKLQGFGGKYPINIKEYKQQNKYRKNKTTVFSVGNIKFLKLAEKCDIIETSAGVFSSQKTAESIKDYDSNTSIIPYSAVFSAMEHYNDNKMGCYDANCLDCKVINYILKNYNGVFTSGQAPAIKNSENIKYTKTFTGYNIIYIKKWFANI